MPARIHPKRRIEDAKEAAKFLRGKGHVMHAAYVEALIRSHAALIRELERKSK